MNILYIAILAAVCSIAALVIAIITLAKVNSLDGDLYGIELHNDHILEWQAKTAVVIAELGDRVENIENRLPTAAVKNKKDAEAERLLSEGINNIVNYDPAAVGTTEM